MSLDWDLTAIADHETLCWPTDPKDGKRYLNPRTDGLIWACVATGIGEITTKDAATFYARLRVWDELHCINRDGRLTMRDVLDHVGLKTNVFPRESDAVFGRKLARAAVDRVTRYARQAQASPDAVDADVS